MAVRQVFISYTTTDRDLAELYRERLELQDVRCWIAPRDVPAGLRYAEAIVDAIEACDVFLLVFSVEASVSPHVGNEIEHAASRNKPIFLVRTDSASPHENKQISLFLASHHWFEASTHDSEEYLPQLVSAVRRLLERQGRGGDGTALPGDDASPRSDALEEARAVEWEGNWEAATAAYRRLVNSSDAHVRCLAMIRLARCLLETCKRGETDEAEDLLAAAAPMTAGEKNGALRGELLLQQARFDDLGGHLKRALQRYEQARAELAEAGADLTEADLVLASAERRRGEFKKALARLEAIDVESLPQRLRAEHFDELGAVLLARGEALAAIDLLEKGLALDEATGTAYSSGRSRLLIAEACMHTGARERAKKLIDETIATYDRANADAGLSDAFALMGNWYEDREDYVSASQYYQDSYDLDRTSDDTAGQVRAKRRLARTYRKRGDSSRAAELLEDAKYMLSPDDDVEAAAIFQEEGQLALTGSEPDYHKAITLFTRALEIAVDDGDERTIALAKRNLAGAYRADDDLPRAEELLLEAKTALENRGDLRALDDLLDDLGEVMLEWDKYDQAELYLNESLALDAKLGRIASKGRSLLLLGRVASRKGNQDQAGRHFQEALSLYHQASNEIGLAEALEQIGGWHLEQGQIKEASHHLHQALEIGNRLNRPLAQARAKRLLAAASRQRGNLDRAEEYLSDARRDLEHIDDPVEQAALDFESGRLDLASGSYRSAEQYFVAARKVFETNGNPVDAASCLRFLAMAAAYDGRYAEALNLLEQARNVFEERKDVLELDELYDDLATVHLLSGRPDAAVESARKSLQLGQTSGWRRGKGRSLVLLAKIAQLGGDLPTARSYLDDAIAVYSEAGDEVGQATAQVELGDWYMEEKTEDPRREKAVGAYKAARRLEQLHRNQRGTARCNRKLALVYLERGEYQRADEALEDARAELRGIEDVREVAPLELALGRLAAARGDHFGAIHHLRSALNGFNRLSQDDRRNSTYRLLVTSHQARGEMKEALECIREMEVERASMYAVLVKDLHPAIAEISYPSFSAGDYGAAISVAFGEIEREFKRRGSALGAGVEASDHVAGHIRAWTASSPADTTMFATQDALEAFGEFCINSFELVNHRLATEDLGRTPGDAFAALAVAHWISQALGTVQGKGRSIEVADEPLPSSYV